MEPFFIKKNIALRNINIQSAKIKIVANMKHLDHIVLQNFCISL